MAAAQSRLLIVYNADGGVWNAIKDAVWKVVSPATYPCSLCALTYGAVSMHGDWQHFLNGVLTPKVFHHRDDFAAAYPDHKIVLPAIVMADENGTLIEVVAAEELNAMSGRTELMRCLESRLATVR